MHVALDALPEITAVEPCSARLAALWVLGRRRRYRITGSSMEPTLHAGQSILLNPNAYRSNTPQVGDVVLIRHPSDASLLTVKRLALIQNPDVFVLGDNRSASTDSRSYGLLPLRNILGRIDCTFP